MKLNFLTLSSISFVWAAERQNLARDSMIGVAGKPTTTIPSPLFKHSLLRQLKHNKFHVLFRTNAIISNKNKYVSLISQINDYITTILCLFITSHIFIIIIMLKLHVLPDFPWHKKQYWNNRGVFVSIHNEAHLH